MKSASFLYTSSTSFSLIKSRFYITNVVYVVYVLCNNDPLHKVLGDVV